VGRSSAYRRITQTYLRTSSRVTPSCQIALLTRVALMRMDSGFTFLLLGPRETLAPFTTYPHPSLLQQSLGFRNILFSEVRLLASRPAPNLGSRGYLSSSAGVGKRYTRKAELGTAGALPGRRGQRNILILFNKQERINFITNVITPDRLRRL
jgi:hypothetical protein